MTGMRVSHAEHRILTALIAAALPDAGQRTYVRSVRFLGRLRPPARWVLGSSLHAIDLATLVHAGRRFSELSLERRQRAQSGVQAMFDRFLYRK